MVEEKSAFEEARVGAVAPNFRLPAAHGPAIALADYRGRRNVILWFSKGIF